MTELRRTVAETKHFRIIEKRVPEKLWKYYSVFILDDDGKEIGWDKAYTLDEAYEICYREIHYRATNKPYVYRKNRNARRNG